MTHTPTRPSRLIPPFVLAALASGCGTEPPDQPDVPPDGTLIRAATGGTVHLGDEVTLTIPPGSLAADTVIAIAAEAGAPAGDADGFTVAGASFRFSPPGTQFALARPAILTMPYDAAALAAQGLDGRTLQLAYFDDELGRYFSIGGEADPVSGLITARVEHFTLYVAMAAGLVPGNNAPTVALQSAIPALIRAGAPVYERATIRDYDVGGSIAGARLHYRSAATSGNFVSLPMTAETTLDTFGALIPGSEITDVGTTDLEYYVTSVDNLGAPRQSTQATVDITRSHAAGTLTLSPATPAIAAGFERTFTVQGRDNTTATYALVPETAAASDGIGLTTIGATGVTFQARTVGVGQVTAGFGAESAALPVTVFNGALARIAFLDEFGVEIEGTLVVKEGTRVQLDALGYDAYGNSILVNPVWTHDPEIGFVSQTGLADTLDGQGGGRVGIQVGDVTANQWFFVTPRTWQTQEVIGAEIPEDTGYQKLTSRNGVPYVAYKRVADNSLRVRHQVGATWVDDGSPSGGVPTDSLAIAAGTSRLQVAWVEGTHVRAAHLEGTTWVRDGGDLEVDPDTAYAIGHSVSHVDLAFDGDTPYLTWAESTLNGYSVHAARWNGSAWVLLGGQVQAAGEQAVGPSIAIHDGVPYVAYQSFLGITQVYVRRWTGAAWETLGGSANDNPGLHARVPELVIVGGRPTVAFRQDDVGGSYYPVYIRQWNGLAWSIVDPGGLFAPPNYIAVATWAIAADGDVLYAAWLEYAPALIRRRVMQRNPRTGVWRDIGTWAHGLVPYVEMSLIVNGTTPYMATDGSFATGNHVGVLAFR